MRTRELLLWLAGQTEWLARRPDAEDAFDELAAAARLIRSAVDTSAGEDYLGPCDACGHPLYCAPDAAEVVCRRCRAVVRVAERRSGVLLLASGFAFNAADAATLLTWAGRPLDPRRVRIWRHRGRIEPTGSDWKGRPLYLVGDVLDLLDADGPDTPEPSEPDVLETGVSS